ncbi:MAG: hypothetical protein V5A72_02725, partial [Candidatus Nanohaloarchaea archaeon]
ISDDSESRFNSSILDDEVSDVINQVYDEIELVGMYASQCVADVASSFDLDSVTIDPQATYGQDLAQEPGEGTYSLSDKLDGHDEEISRFVDGFDNEEVAGRIKYGGDYLQNSPKLMETFTIDFEVKDHDKGVELIT